jgi:hypothetical protein
MSQRLHPRPPAPRTRHTVVALLAATALFTAVPALAPVSGLTLAPTAAHAADSDVVSIPDANLKAKLNTALGGGRTATQDITVGEAAAKTGSLSLTGPFADLTGLQAFTNATSLSLRGAGNTFTTLAPVAGLTKLTTVSIASSQAPSLVPLAGLTNVATLTVNESSVTDASPLTALTKLTYLNLGDNQIGDANLVPSPPNVKTLLLNRNWISDLTRLPSLPNVTELGLGGNRIVNPAPVLDKIDPAKLATLTLSRNRITNASALVPLGSGKVGAYQTTGEGLLLAGNRITDLTPFDSWTKPPDWQQWSPQNLYVGAYQAGGIVLPELKPGVAYTDALKVDPPSAGSYDPVTRRVTLTDPSAPSVALSSLVPGNTLPQQLWVVNFSGPPVEPGDPTGPTVGGAMKLGEQLSVADVGPTLASCNPSALTYRWLRDGEELTGNRYPGDSLQYMGGTGDSPEYRISATDVGHLLSVRLTCTTTGVSSASSPTLVTGDEPDKPVVQPLEGAGFIDLLVGGSFTLGGVFPSGVLGDPTNPSGSIYVGQLAASGQLVDPALLSVSVASVTYLNGYSGPHPIEAQDVQITGTGAQRTISITPHFATVLAGSNTGEARVTLSVTGTTGKTTPYTFTYLASTQTTPTSRVLMGSSDTSSAIAVGGGYLMVADDEKHEIRLYDGERSGREAAQFLPGPSDGEIDAESSVRKGNSIWWFGSHGNNKDQQFEPSRASVYETKLTGSGAEAKIVPTGVVYRNLRADLFEWDNANHDRVGFDVGQGKTRPEDLDGFNIEGAEFSPDGSQLYLGLRAPIVPAQPGGKAVIVPVTNFAALTAGTASTATFADPIFLDLGGDSIREIRKNARNEYLILSAPAGVPSEQAGGPTQTLWAWNGDRDYAPRKLTTVIQKDVEPEHSDNAGAWEGIGEMPERLAPGAQVRLIMDQGYDELYGRGTENKDDTNDFTSKARTDIVALEGPVGTLAALSGSGSFGEQAANTIGAAKKVTVTNSGSNVLHVGPVSTEGEDETSANDFLVNNNTCSGEALDPTESCTMFVRFAPSRESTTSGAQLVVKSDVPGGRSTVALSGTSTTLPKGEDGRDGVDGQDGAQGPQGPAGQDGQDGIGSPGAKGDKGDGGPQGPVGPFGPIGPLGPQGPAGVPGPAGKTGSFVFSSKRSSVSVRRGRTLSLSFVAENDTAATVAGSTATATVPKALKVSGKRSVKIASLKQGQSRNVLLMLKVSKTAKVGSHKVKVALKIGGRSVARTVTVRVKR